MRSKGPQAPGTAEGQWETSPVGKSACAAPGVAMPVCVIGCGRRHRRDDQIGLRVAEALESNPPPHTTLRTSQAPGVDLIADLEGVDLLVVVDAAQATQEFPVGEATRIDYLGSSASAGPPRLTPPRTAQSDPSHMLEVNNALKLGRDLKILPQAVWIYTVAGQDFDYGEEVSPGVEAAVRSVAEQIHSDVGAWLQRRETGRA
jgi:hydrogenase maturation protease